LIAAEKGNTEVMGLAETVVGIALDAISREERRERRDEEKKRCRGL
jgi:hypothetical protein